MIINQLHVYKNKDVRRIAYYLLLKKLLLPVDTLSQTILRSLNKEKSPTTYDTPVVFIIGVPRSGTTMIYQYLNLVLNVTYTHNLWSVLPKSAPYIKQIINAVPPVDFDSFYGNGAKWLSPQEGGTIFDQWFKDKKQHYYPELGDKKKQQMKSYFDMIWKRTRKPLLIKNGRNALRLKVLAEVFENARFIRVHRSVSQIAQSILIGRKILKGYYNQNWTVVPKEWETIKNLHYCKQVAMQVYYIDQQIESDLQTIPADAKFDIEYNDFCKNPFKTTKELCSKFPELKLRDTISDTLREKVFRESKNIKIAKDDFEYISNELKKLYQEKYYD